MPATTTQKPLLGKFRLGSTLYIETGLHIGGGGETLDIGGLDKPVIRDPLTQHPYLPGSSIKGKLRSILERLMDKPVNRAGGSGTFRYESDDLEDGFTEIEVNEPNSPGAIEIRNSKGQPKRIRPIFFTGAGTCCLSRIFGSTGKDCWIETDAANRVSDLIDRDWMPVTYPPNGKSYNRFKGRNCPARLIVRDCHLSSESADKLKKVDTGLFMTEWKFENGIDRITAAANPRQVERVPAGSEFNFELIYTVENVSQAREDLKNLAIALAILEDDALGGHGSRGYGKIRFQNFDLSYRDYSQFARGESPASTPLSDLKNTDQLLRNFSQVENLLPEG